MIVLIRKVTRGGGPDFPSSVRGKWSQDGKIWVVFPSGQEDIAWGLSTHVSQARLGKQEARSLMICRDEEPSMTVVK